MDRWQQMYRDEPIRRPDTQIRSDLPEQYRRMRALAFQSGTNSMSSAEVFYRQAQFMASFEDDYVYPGEFIRYYPTYQSMSDAQLRGYFSWRTRVRRGDIQPTSLSYAFVYLYELLHCVGADTPQDAFETLRHFTEVYGAIDPGILHYARQWMQDFVVYYALDPALLAQTDAVQFDRNLAVLRTFETQTPQALFASLSALSTYNPERSRFYKAQPDVMRDVVCAVYRALSAYYASHRRFTLCDAYFGRLFTAPFTLFYSAIFFATRPAQDADYALSPLTSFACRGGRWTCTRIWGTRAKSGDLGALLRTVDALLRERYDFPYPLKTEQTPKYVRKIILDCIDDVRKRAEEKAAREVHIDLSRLQTIRDAAETTRDSLIVEEEALPSLDMPAPVEMPTPPETADDVPQLNATELAVLQGVLEGRDVQPMLQKQGMLLSVVAETINEKCYDFFADTVLLFDGDTPQIPQEYAAEVKGWIK